MCACVGCACLGVCRCAGVHVCTQVCMCGVCMCAHGCACVCVCTHTRSWDSQSLSPSLKLEPLTLPADNCQKNVAAGAELQLIWL